MTTVQTSIDIMRSLSIDAIDAEIDNNNLSLPMAALMDANPLPLFPMTSLGRNSSLGSLTDLERAISNENPLVRTYSNVSVSSDAGDAHFVPWGSNADLDAFKSTRAAFTFPEHSDKLVPLSGPNEGNITPRTLINLVPSKAPSRLSPLPQEPDTDYETGTSSRVTPSVDHYGARYGADDDDEPECEDGVADTGLNVGASSFVPTPATSLFGGFGCHTPAVPMTLPLPLPMNAMMAPPPGLSIHRGINGMMNHAVNHEHQQQLPVQQVGMMRDLQLNVPSLYIEPRNVVNGVVGVQGSPGQNGLHSAHHTPDRVTTMNGYGQCMDRLSPATANGMASPAGYGQCAQNYMGAVQQTHSASPMTRSQGFRQNTLHRPSQSPPVASPQLQPQVQHGGFSPQRPPMHQQQQCMQRQGARYSAQRPTESDQNGKAVDVQHMIRIGASLPQLLERGLVIPFMKHQNGSRYIQERLSKASSSLITSILRLIIFEKKEIVSLSEDIFGNYVVQIFFEQFAERNRKRHDAESAQWIHWLIEHLLRGNAFRLSRHLYGCRVIQNAFDCIPTPQSINLIEEIKKHGRTVAPSGRTLLEECITCHHGNHVVQKIITLGLPIAHIQFIVDCVANNIPLYSQHQYGCRIVQNIINLYGYEGNKRVLREVVKRDNLLKLCRSQYGNYVIQHVLKLNEHSNRTEYDDQGRLQRKGWQHCPQKYHNDKCMEIKATVIETVFGSVEQLSKNKYGSNVVEKCLYRATEKEAEMLLDSILGPQPLCKTRSGGSLLREMANHQFANYVIQNIIQECTGKQRERMITGINTHIPDLKALKYGKHILEKIHKVRFGASGHGQKRYNY